MPSAPISATSPDWVSRFNVVLLDRDGVINHDSPDYIKNVKEWHPINGSIDAIVTLQQAGARVAVCTNQAGIGRGIIEPDDLAEIHECMQKHIEQHGGERIPVYFCPHHPDEGCRCRKPAPGLLLDALETFRATPDIACFIGDSARDLDAADAAGCEGVLVLTGHGADTLKDRPEARNVIDLAAFARLYAEGSQR